jgi:hypothetical protein
VEKKKDHFIRLSIVISLFWTALSIPQFGQSETLKSLAYRSTVILALSENDSMAKKCQVDSAKISLLSQRLKAKIDKKIAELTEGDFKIIKARAKTCSSECICNVYALAISNAGSTDVILERKAATESPQDRRRCVRSWKDYCDLIKF